MQSKSAYGSFTVILIALTLMVGCEIPALKNYVCQDPDYPYYCSAANTCCSYAYYRKASNACHQTFAGCTANGNSCETCAIEANNPILETLMKYDGTYNWSLSNVNGVNSSCFDCAFISNGQLTIDGTFLGPISVDDFGNLTFHGPCPNGNNAQGTFSGTKGGSTFNAWQGTWSCSDGSSGGSASIWKLFQD